MKQNPGCCGWECLLHTFSTAMVSVFKTCQTFSQKSSCNSEVNHQTPLKANGCQFHCKHANFGSGPANHLEVPPLMFYSQVKKEKSSRLKQAAVSPSKEHRSFGSDEGSFRLLLSPSAHTRPLLSVTLVEFCLCRHHHHLHDRKKRFCKCLAFSVSCWNTSSNTHLGWPGLSAVRR